jgi:hypothetical protein
MIVNLISRDLGLRSSSNELKSSLNDIESIFTKFISNLGHALVYLS